MKAQEKKTLINHLKKDDKEFRNQIKDDVKLKKEILKSKKEPKESKAHERKEERKK